MLELFSGYFGATFVIFGNILWLFWGYFGGELGAILGYVGVIFALFWGYFEEMSGLF